MNTPYNTYKVHTVMWAVVIYLINWVCVCVCKKKPTGVRESTGSHSIQDGSYSQSPNIRILTSNMTIP